MKIIWITIESILPANSGGRIGVFRRLEQLSKNNDIFLFYTMDNINDKQYINELKRYCVEVHGYLRNKKSLATILNCVRAPFTVASRRNTKLIYDVNKCLIENKIDVINVDSPHMGLNLLKIKTNVPMILNQHNIEWKVYMNIAKSNKSLIKRFIYCVESIRFNIFEKYLYNKVCFRLITFVSMEDMDYFNRIHKVNSTLTIVPVGAIDYIDNYDWECNGSSKILFVGKMNYAPNVEAVVNFATKIFPAIKNKVSNAEFWIVGKDPATEVISLQSDSIIVTGSVPSVDEYYENCDLVVIPLNHGGGVKIKLLEALGHKIPVISSKIGIQGTEFCDSDLLVYESEQDFIQKCIDFLNNRKEYQLMYKKLFEKFSNNYTWEKIGEDYCRLLLSASKYNEVEA